MLSTLALFIMIVNRLPELMAQKGISIRKLSLLTGVTYTTIRAIYHCERRSVQLAVLDAICQAMEIQPGDLYIFIPEGTIYQEPTKIADHGMSRPELQDQTMSPSSEEELSDGWKNW